jgi:predicted PurR-regulated permease PerM
MIFVGINLLLFMALFLLIDRVLIPIVPQLIETIKEFNQKVRNNRRLRKIKKLKDKLIQNRQDLSESLTQKLSQIAFHRSSELKIESNYYHAVSSYKEIIIKGFNSCHTGVLE